MENDRTDDEEEGWEYGDVWKEGSPDAPGAGDDIQYVEILRRDTGMGYDDSTLIDLVAYLGYRGIRATFDTVSLGMELAALKTYVLKVEVGREEEARRYVEEKFGTHGRQRE